MDVKAFEELIAASERSRMALQAEIINFDLTLHVIQHGLTDPLMRAALEEKWEEAVPHLQKLLSTVEAWTLPAEELKTVTDISDLITSVYEARLEE